jgi:hypothetical protein
VSRNQYLLLMAVGGWLTYRVEHIRKNQDLQFQATLVVAAGIDEVNDTIKAIEDEAVQEVVDEVFGDIVDKELGDLDG